MELPWTEGILTSDKLTDSIVPAPVSIASRGKHTHVNTHTVDLNN